ncbi:hypothetical protein ACKKBF_B12705 [Auxenochlorella protothecoides x Auxenochlorella symbiontica]
MTSEAGPLPEASERNSRDASTSKPSADPEGSTIVFAKRRNRGSIRKKPTSEAGGEGAEAGEGLAPLIKRPARTQAPAQGTEQPASGGRPFAFESSNTLQQSQDGGATRNLETETAHDRDARALREQVLAQQVEEGGAEGATYKGMNNYRDYRAGFRREQTIGAEKGGGAHGPLRASTNVRMTVRVDYQPDICKDYKETGYCGFGDACKFLHDRGDYKAGYELDREWEEKQKRERERLLTNWAGAGEAEASGSESEDDEGLPFACFSCREPWHKFSDPVVTRCGHYFCEQCALKENARTGRCPACGQALQGIFNVAHDVVKRWKEAQKG